VKKRKPLPQQWKPGQSGNPAGRPPGTGKKQLMKQAQVQAARELGISHQAASLLRENSPQITEEILRIALAPDKETVKRKVVDGQEIVTVTVRPGDAKIRCLLACLDRLLPALKSVEVKDRDTNDPKDMSDSEIIDLMNRMVGLATGSDKPKIH
jgi:hypothetical protein